MSMTKEDLDTGLRQHLLKAYSDYFTATKAAEEAEARIKQLNFTISMITERDKTDANRNPE